MKKSYSQKHLFVALAVGLFVGAMGVLASNSSSLLYGSVDMAKMPKPAFTQTKEQQNVQKKPAEQGKEGQLPGSPKMPNPSMNGSCDAMKEKVEKMFMILQKAPWVQGKDMSTFLKENKLGPVPAPTSPTPVPQQ